MKRTQIDWTRVKFNQRELAGEILQKFSARGRAKTEGFLASEVEDYIEKTVGRKAWAKQVCFGNGEFSDVLFNSGMLHDDIIVEIKRTHISSDGVADRIYLCNDEHQQGPGDKSYKQVSFFTAEDWERVSIASDNRRASALRQRNASHDAATCMRSRNAKFWSEIPEYERNNILHGTVVRT